MINNEKLISILESKIEEGYGIIEELDISSKDFETAILNLFQCQATIKGLKNEGKEVQELNAYDKAVERNEVVELKSNEEIEKALSKNKDVEI